MSMLNTAYAGAETLEDDNQEVEEYNPTVENTPIMMVVESGAINTDYIRQKLSPKHILIATLRAKGATVSDIEKATKVSKVTIYSVLKEKAVREFMALEIRRSAQSLEDILHLEAIESLSTICNLRDNAVSESVRFSCSKELLDRYLGKSTQVIRKDESPKTVDEAERRLIEAEAELKKYQDERI